MYKHIHVRNASAGICQGPPVGHPPLKIIRMRNLLGWLRLGLLKIY